MRTAPAPTSNKITLATAAKNACAPKRSADDERSSFDQILQKRNTPTREEPKSADAEAPPKKTERSSKRGAATTKPRASKAPPNETDPNHPTMCAQQSEQ